VTEMVSIMIGDPAFRGVPSRTFISHRGQLSLANPLRISTDDEYGDRCRGRRIL